MKLRSGFGYDTMAASNEAGLKCEDESRTIQSAAEECDINTIVRRFGLTGQLPENLNMPQSGDFQNVPDFHGAMQIVRQAEEEFARVPAHIRARFVNDPQRLMSFLEDESNRDEAVKLGLVKPPEPIPLSVPPAPTV